MSFKEIKQLRQAGKLDEALQMAHQALEAEPYNIWNKRAAAWVYYDYIKKNAQPESFEAFKENLTKIKDLRLPEDEKWSLTIVLGKSVVWFLHYIKQSMLIMAKSMNCLKSSGTFISPSHLKRTLSFTRLFTKAIKTGQTI